MSIRIQLSKIMRIRIRIRYVKAIYLFIYFVFFNTFIPNHIHTMMPYIHQSPFAEASLHFLIALVLGGDKPPCALWCRAENRTRACLPASRRATNWAAPHHNWATPHHTEPRRTITEPRRTILSHAAPCLSHAAPYWATPHHDWATPHHTEPRRTIKAIYLQQRL